MCSTIARRAAAIACAIFLTTLGLTACESSSPPRAASSRARTTSGPATRTPTSSAPTPAATPVRSLPTPSATPSASPTGQEDEVGPLFFHGRGQPHGCSASVLSSPGRDLILTAAHCINGTAAGDIFAPGYRDGNSPFGDWTVLRAWVDPRWNRDHDPDVDFAILQVRARVIRGVTEQVQQVVGATVLGRTPAPGTTVSVVGYTHGLGDRQITCTNRLVLQDEFPSFDCHGYVGGTSGSPFLAGHRPSVVVGIVGGLHYGGCTEGRSYSPPFDTPIHTLYARAVDGTRADTVAPAPGDGC